ncbi:hypothetical protein J6O48_12390 [bacterium]|nr:hypothetical protein [bacterium]
MGLAASQARLLTLTARQHSLEYGAQRLEALKLQLANESDKAYNEYLEKLDATKIKYRVVENDGSITYDDATFAKLTENNFLFNVCGTVCKSFDEVKQQLKDNGIVDLSVGDSYTLLSTLISEGYVVIMEVSDDPNSGYEYKNGKIEYVDINDNVTTRELNDKFDTKDTEKAAYKVFKDTSVSTSTRVQEVSDEVGLKKAEAEYEANMNRINAKDARYDTELSQLETERNAIKTEIDTLKNVAKDNVDRTFKIFS